MLATALERLAEQGHYVLDRCEWMDGLCIDAYGLEGRPATEQILHQFASCAPRMKYLETELAASLEQKARQIYPDLPWPLETNVGIW
jgi:hypothetical protein